MYSGWKKRPYLGRTNSKRRSHMENTFRPKAWAPKRSSWVPREQGVHVEEGDWAPGWASSGGPCSVPTAPHSASAKAPNHRGPVRLQRMEDAVPSPFPSSPLLGKRPNQLRLPWIFTSYSLIVPFHAQPSLGQMAGRLSTSRRAALSGKASKGKRGRVKPQRC